MIWIISTQSYSRDSVIPSDHRILLFIRCVFGTMGLCSYYFAFMVCTCRRTLFYEKLLFNLYESSLHTINCFASKFTKTPLKIYDSIFIDIYLAYAIRRCKYDWVYFDVFYLHLWTNISQRKLEMGPFHQYIHSHWRDHTHCPGKNIEYH